MTHDAIFLCLFRRYTPGVGFVALLTFESHHLHMGAVFSHRQYLAMAIHAIVPVRS